MDLNNIIANRRFAKRRSVFFQKKTIFRHCCLKPGRKMVKNEQKISTKVTITTIDLNIRNKKHNSENMIHKYI